MSYEEPTTSNTMPVAQAQQRAYEAADKTLKLIDWKGRKGNNTLREHFASRYMLLLAQKYVIVSSTHSLVLAGTE